RSRKWALPTIGASFRRMAFTLSPFWSSELSCGELRFAQPKPGLNCRAALARTSRRHGGEIHRLASAVTARLQGLAAASIRPRAGRPRTLNTRRLASALRAIHPREIRNDVVSVDGTRRRDDDGGG